MLPEEQALLMLELDKVKVHCSSELWLDPQCELLGPQLLLPGQSNAAFCHHDGGFSCSLKDLELMV